MRLAVALLLVAAAAAPVPAAVAKPRPPTVAGTTVVYGVGSVSVDLTVPKGVSLVARAPANGESYGFAGFLSTERWSAVALISRTARYAGQPVSAVQVHLPHPDHCPSQFAPTVTPVPPCDRVVAHSFVNGPPPATAGASLRYPLPAGTYQVVVSGPPRTPVAVVLQFAGAYRGRVVAATRPVTAALARHREENLALAHVTGSFSRTFSGNGIGVVGLWHTVAGEEPGEFTYAQCVAPGTAAPLEPDGCTAVGVSGTDPPEGLAHRPAFFAASAGGFTLTPHGDATWVTPVLRKGTYTNTFRVTRGGRGPAAGVFVWWLQADALK